MQGETFTRCSQFRAHIGRIAYVAARERSRWNGGRRRFLDLGWRRSARIFASQLLRRVLMRFHQYKGGSGTCASLSLTKRACRAGLSADGCLSVRSIFRLAVNRGSELSVRMMSSKALNAMAIIFGLGLQRTYEKW